MHIGQGDRSINVTAWPGDGPPALLVHGIGSSGASWNELIPLLQPFLQPYAVDLRGHGESAHPATGYLYDDYIDDLDQIVDTLRLAHPVLIGHSLGGIVALWWAARHPARASAVIVVDSPLRSGEEFRPAFDGWIAQNAMAVDDLAAHYLEQNPEWEPTRARRRAEIMTNTAPGVFRELKVDSLRHDGEDRIAELLEIQSPVLLVRGEPQSGSMVHPEDAEALVSRLPNAEVEVVPGGGHSLHRQFPEQFIEATHAFLARHEIIDERGQDS